MEKVLGLDLGTNSIGWAIIERKSEVELVDRGVHIFQEGVHIENGNESSKASERTDHRALRRHYFRRRLRKIETLSVLSDLGYCPKLTPDQLKDWKNNGNYPLTDELIKWQQTDDGLDKNPYHCRLLAINGKLEDKYIVGRALYHICQRRGFLSNRLESTKDREGVVTDGINKLTQEIQQANCRTLGEYFYKCYGEKKIRSRYTSRLEHYKAEFDEICRVQQIPPEHKLRLECAIFFQRPLKSQKGLVGKCTFEPKKSRCPISHPRYEYYRMLCFVNNIRIKTPNDEQFRALNGSEKEEITPLFLRSKDSFEFEDIAKKLAGKNNYGTKDRPNGKPYLFNFALETSVSGMPLTSKLRSVLGDDLAVAIRACYTLAKDKSDEELINDIWHVLFNFDKDDKIAEFAIEKLGLDEKAAEKFLKIYPHQGYASLSLKATNKIIKYLERGYIYSHAVFLANMEQVVSKDDWWKYKQMIEDGIGDIVDGYRQYRNEIVENNEYLAKEMKVTPKTIQRRIFDFLMDCGCGLSGNYEKKLYHPSMVDSFPASQTGKLGSPRTNSVRNPMAMRTLFQLRRLINTLLEQGKITPDTKINIELARELNNANKRKAIELWQRERDKEYKQYAAEIKTYCGIDATNRDLLKYRLWIEQDKHCVYTGEQISLCDFLGENPRYDIEHTIPRSRGGDDSQMNKTLCEATFNREVKGAKTPFELSNFEKIKVRIEPWRQKIEELNKQVEKRRGRYFATKEDKDRNIIFRNKLIFELDYWRGKYDRMVTTDLSAGYKKSQIVDAGIISKYAKLYLQSLFPKTYAIKGGVTADFRKLWGLEQEYQKKDRSNHIHHCIDAVVIACIGKYQKDLLSHHKGMDEYKLGRADRVVFKKPWETFTQDVLKLSDEVLVSHYTASNLGKHTKKKVRQRGKVIPGKHLQGDTARGSLHKETLYGAILRDDELKYVVRKSLSALKNDDVAKIVDEVVRDKVQQAVDQYGFKAIQDMDDCPIWMNEQKGVQIKKVRCFTPLVKDPLHIRTHRDQSTHPHKQQIHVVNESNYAMAIYQGVDKKGKPGRKFEIINNIDASSRLKQSAKTQYTTLIPISQNGFPLKCIIKTGTMVLFWKETPDEIWELGKSELVKRLYKVTKLSKDGRLTFKHSQESRNDESLKSDYEKMHGHSAPKTLTDGVSSVDLQAITPKLLLSPTNFNMLVQGFDFELTITGEVKPIRRC